MGKEIQTCMSYQTLDSRSEESSGPQLAGFLTLLPPAPPECVRASPAVIWQVIQQLSTVYCIT